jgi:hypothetical protein
MTKIAKKSEAETHLMPASTIVEFCRAPPSTRCVLRSVAGESCYKKAVPQRVIDLLLNQADFGILNFLPHSLVT